jgi:hypothetical protein
MAYSDLNAIHNPSTGNSPPATWGDQVALNDDYLYLRGPYICTAATRPGSPFEGQLIYQTDTNTYLSYDGAAWWTVGRAISTATSYTPTLTQLGAVAKNVDVGEYTVCDGWCDFTFHLTCNGVGGTGNNAVTVSLPLTAAAAGTRPVGSGGIFEDAAGAFWAGSWRLNATTTIALVANGTGNNNYWGVTPITGLTADCLVSGHVRYRIASAA